MSELMPCQMCGGEPEPVDSCYNMIEFRAECANDDCRISGPTIYFDECDRGDEAKELSAQRWNEMQTYIARGKLLDTPAAPSTKARL